MELEEEEDQKKLWLQNVWNDINTMRVTGWREKARDRDIWRRIAK